MGAQVYQLRGNQRQGSRSGAQQRRMRQRHSLAEKLALGIESVEKKRQAL